MKKRILLIMATVFMLGLLSACSKSGSNVNDTVAADNRDIEIVDNDEIMIYKLTADNVNSINEKISKYRNIIRIRIFCLQDNDMI